MHRRQARADHPHAGMHLRQISLAGLSGDGVKHLLHRITATSAKIEGAAGFASKQMLQRRDVCLGKVRDVNIVSDRGAVWGGIVRPEQRKILDMTLDCHHRPWNEMGFRIAQLPDLHFGIGAAGVEISNMARHRNSPHMAFWK